MSVIFNVRKLDYPEENFNFNNIVHKKVPQCIFLYELELDVANNEIVETYYCTLHVLLYICMYIYGKMANTCTSNNNKCQKLKKNINCFRISYTVCRIYNTTSFLESISVFMFF